jgi:hypothetical protein
VATAWLNLFLALCAWGVLGLVIAVLTRSAAVSISIGVGYLLVVESLIKMVKDAPSDWLLGTTLGARRRRRLGGGSVRHGPRPRARVCHSWPGPRGRRVRPPGRDGLTASKTSSTRVVDEVMT